MKRIFPIALWATLLTPAIGSADDVQVVGATADGSRVAVVRVEADIPRGFNRQSLTVLSVPDGEVLSEAPLVKEPARARYAKAGDFELYRTDLDRARAEQTAALVRDDGFVALLPVPLRAEDASDPRNPNDPPLPGRLTLAGHAVDLEITNDIDTLQARITLRAGDRQVELSPHAIDMTPIDGRPETVTWRWFSVREAWRDAGGDTLLLVVDTYVPMQHRFAARSVLVMADLAPIAVALQLEGPVAAHTGPAETVVASRAVRLGSR